MREYRFAKKWALLMYVACPLLFFVSGYILLLPLYTSAYPRNFYLFMFPFMVATLGLTVLGFLDTIKAKAIIDANGISYVSTLENKSLKTFEIKGFQAGKNYIYIVPKFDDLKKIKISTYFSNTEEITQWLASRFPEINHLNYEAEKREIVNNYELGDTTEARLQNQEKARRLVYFANWFSGILAVVTFFWPHPIALSLCVILPIIALIATIFYKGLIQVDLRFNSFIPSVILVFLLPTLTLIYRAVTDYIILDYTNVWGWLVVFVGGMVIIFMLGKKASYHDQPRHYFADFNLLLFIIAYGYGSVITLNAAFDHSKTEVYIANVLDKRISQGQTTSYFLTLAAWGKQRTQEEVQVSEEVFNNLNPGEKASIHLKKGSFNIPWYVVTE